jgi:hypothetical protein
VRGREGGSADDRWDDRVPPRLELLAARSAPEEHRIERPVFVRGAVLHRPDEDELLAGEY